MKTIKALLLILILTGISNLFAQNARLDMLDFSNTGGFLI